MPSGFTWHFSKRPLTLRILKCPDGYHLPPPHTSEHPSLRLSYCNPQTHWNYDTPWRLVSLSIGFTHNFPGPELALTLLVGIYSRHDWKGEGRNWEMVLKHPTLPHLLDGCESSRVVSSTGGHQILLPRENEKLLLGLGLLYGPH